MSSNLPIPIADYLKRVVMRARRRATLAAALWAAAVLGAWMLAACGLDRVMHFPAHIRLGLLAGGVAGAIAISLWPWRRGGRRVDWVAVAQQVEAHQPVFDQRLVTLTSRLLGPAAHRGSEAMLEHLQAQVEDEIRRHPSPAMLPGGRRLVWPMLACAMVIAAAAGLLRLPGLGLPQLAERLVLPWRPTPAVTTTKLFVQPDRDSDLTNSAELRVDVAVERLGDGVVSLFARPADASGPWSRLTMDQLSTGSPARFEYLFAGIDRDLRYYFAGGDAMSRVYAVRLLRKPAVSEMSVRYHYPAYVRQAEATVVSNDGRLEAPIGTTAEITLAATEPLRSATLRLGSQTITMSPGVHAGSFSAMVPIEADRSGTLEMITKRNMTGSEPVRIRALPIRPPVLRVTDASGEPGATLSINPRQVLPVQFEAQDDFGLQGLALHWRINQTRSGQLAVAIPDGVRHIEDAIDFDLASLPLRVGDVLSVWLEVQNTAGVKTASQPIEALIAARPVDAEMRQRLVAMDAAAGFADRLAEHLLAAQPNPLSPATSAALSSATEDAGLLRQSLLRIIAHGAPAQTAMALAGWVDAATEQSYWADRLFEQLGDSGALDPPAASQLAASAASAQTLRQQLRIVAQGQWAQASLAEWEDVSNSHAQSDAAARIRQNALDDAKAAGCADGPDLPTRLTAQVAAADALLAAQGPVDFIPPAQQWAAEVSARPQTHPSLSQRLRSAAEAEALRQHGDLPAAGDWELASRAADSLEALAADRKPHAQLQEFVDALSALQREHRMDAATALPVAAEQNAVRSAATVARKRVERWARMADGMTEHLAAARSTSAVSPRARARSSEAAAIAASAEAASHRGTAPLPAGSIVAGRPIPAAHIRGDLAANRIAVEAQQIDTIGQKQEELLEQTSVAQPAEAPSLAQRQQQVADSIATVAAGSEPDEIGSGDKNTANWRQREAETLQSIGQQLAEMPQQMATAQDALGDAAAATAHAGWEQKKLAGLKAAPAKTRSADLIAAAQRSAQQSTSDADDAGRRLWQSMQPVSPATARQMGDRLAPFVPEASGAESTIRDQLAPALSAFENALRARDALAGERAAASARNAVGAALQGIAEAQDALAARDPLVTASSSARAAVASLRNSPPDFSTAVRRQTQVTLALSRAWDQSIHGAAAERLAAVPGLQPIFAAGAGNGPGGGGQATLSAQVGPPPGQPWMLAPTPTNDAGGGAGAENSDPPGFEDALRLYFDALGRAQKEGK